MTDPIPIVRVIIALALVVGLVLITVAGALRCPKCGRWDCEH